MNAPPEISADAKPLRVVMLIASFVPAAEGGTERQCRLLSTELVRRGHAVQVLTRWPEGRGAKRRETLGGFRVARLGIGHPLSSFVRSLRRRRPATGDAANVHSLEQAGAKISERRKVQPTAPLVWLEYLLFQAALFVWFWRHREECDVVHAHESHWLAGYAMWLGRVFGRPVIIKEATYPVFMAAEVPAPGRRKWERLRLGGFYFAQTAAAAADLASAGVPAERIFVVPNGVLIPECVASPAGSTEVLYVGNLHQGAEWKGFDVLFGAWCQVAAAGLNARLSVVGAGDATTWREFLRARGVEGSVSFCGASLDVSEWYARAALLVLPSRREGMPNAVLEAQAWGLPAVVSDIPGCRAAVQAGESGMIVPVGDVDRLAATIVQLLGEPERRSHMGCAARAWAKGQFEFSHVASDVALCYRRVMDRQTLMRQGGR